jgi:hypothetical protein
MIWLSFPKSPARRTKISFAIAHQQVSPLRSTGPSRRMPGSGFKRTNALESGPV